jgi:hypothetical protein
VFDAGFETVPCHSFLERGVHGSVRARIKHAIRLLRLRTQAAATYTVQTGPADVSEHRSLVQAREGHNAPSRILYRISMA